MSRRAAFVEHPVTLPRAVLGSLGISPQHEIALLYDGDCPLCAREVAWLESLRRAGDVLFIDIAGPSFDASALGLEHDDLMGEIHAIDASGEIVRGMEVFRRVYAALGLGWIVAPTRLPGLRWLSEAAYRFFARHRLRLTGRAGSAGVCPR